jgi:hypothetical protein
VERDVTPVVRELLLRSAFQAQARWPIDHLVAGASSNERSLVEAIDAGLVAAGRLFTELRERPGIAAALDARPLASGQAAAHDCDQGVDPESARDSSPPFGDPPRILAGRPWHDLACAADYFGPTCDLNLIEREAWLGPDAHAVQIAELVPYFNSALQPLGDYVTQMLLLRIEYWQHQLQLLYARYDALSRDEHGGEDLIWGTLQECRQKLAADLASLREACRGGTSFKTREACIILVQIYAACWPKVDFCWLGPAAPFSQQAARICDRIKKQHDAAIPEQIAAALAEVAGMYRAETDPESIIQEACQTQPLVLVEGPGRREVYWKGKRLNTDWQRHGAPWTLLVLLAERHRAGVGADTIDAADSARRFSIKDARSRLKILVPRDLTDCIVPAGRRTYKLQLAPTAVRLLRFTSSEQIE